MPVNTAPHYISYENTLIMQSDGTFIGAAASGMVTQLEQFFTGGKGFGAFSFASLVKGNAIAGAITQFIVNDDGTVNVGELAFEAAATAAIALALFPVTGSVLATAIGASLLYSGIKSIVTGAIDIIASAPTEFIDFMTSSETTEVQFLDENSNHKASVFFPVNGLTPSEEKLGVEKMLQSSDFDMAGGTIEFHHQVFSVDVQLSGFNTYNIYNGGYLGKIVNVLQNETGVFSYNDLLTVTNGNTINIAAYTSNSYLNTYLYFKDGEAVEIHIPVVIGGVEEVITINNIYDSTGLVVGKGLGDVNLILGEGSSSVTITGSGKSDLILSGSLADNLSGGGGDDTIIGNGGIDLLDGGANNDVLEGGAGNDNLLGDTGDDKLYGGNDNDYLVGGTGNDTLYGDAGNDIIEGGDGDDLFVMLVETSITDTVNDFTEGDQLSFRSTSDDFIIMNLSYFDVSNGPNLNVVQMGNDTHVMINGHTTVLVDYDSTNLVDPDDHADVFGGPDASTFDPTALGGGRYIPFNDLDGGNVVNGADNSQKMNSSYTDADGDSVTNYADIIIGNKGWDSLYGYNGNDTYIFQEGDGHDIISENAGINGGSDAIVIKGMQKEDIHLNRNNNDLYIRYGDSGDEVRVSQHFNGRPVESVNGMDVTGGLTLYGRDNMDEKIHGHTQNDIFYGGNGWDSLYGYSGDDEYHFAVGDGHDIIVESSSTTTGGSDSIFIEGMDTENIHLNRSNNDLYIRYGDNGDEVRVSNHFNGRPVENVNGIDITGGLTLYGRENMGEKIHGHTQNDIFHGGNGWDSLYGYSGDDEYHFAVGDGHDKITESSNTTTGGNDSIIIAGVSTEEIYFNVNYNDLVITYGDGTDSITISSHFAGRQVETVNGTSLTSGLTFYEKEGASQTFNGTSLNDTFVGNDGNDTLRGGGGDDSYTWGTGYGSDYINDLSGSNTLTIVNTGGNVTWTNYFSDAIVTIDGTNETLTINDYYNSWV